MTQRFTTPRKLVVWAAATVITIVVLRTPAVQTVLVGGLVEFAGVAGRILQLPYRLLDHTHCFSLDRLDPTCPQCM